MITDAPHEGEFIIGLTEADIVRMRNGYHVHLNPKDVGMVNIQIRIGIARSDAEIDKAKEKYKDNPDVVMKSVNSDRLSEN